MRWMNLVVAILIFGFSLCAMTVVHVGVVFAQSSATNTEPEGVIRARTFINNGAYQEALPLLAEAARSYGAEENYSQQLKAMVLMAYAYQAIGQYTEAQKSLESAMAIAQKHGNQREMASIYAGLGDLYGVSGQNEKALQYLNGGLAIG